MEERKPKTDPAREASDLLSLAEWYRCWAKISDGTAERARRLEMAEYFEAKARQLLSRGTAPG
jgi:hypothetical protein